MEIVTASVLLVLFSFTILQGICLISYLSKRGKKSLPPGPARLPVIGNLHLLGDKPHQSLANLAKKHGPIMCLKLGQLTSIVVSSPEMAKQVLKTQDLAFSGRSIPNSLYAHDLYKYSVVLLPVADPMWRTLRKVINANIFSVKRLDDNQHLVNKKVEAMIEYCRRNSETGKAVNVGRAAFVTVLNSLSNIIVSKDLTDPDPFSDSVTEFRESVWNTMVEGGKPNLVDYFPFLAKIDPQGIRRRMTVHLGKILQIFKGLIDERLRSGGISRGAITDVLDVLLTISHETPEQIDRKHIEHLCADLFIAGTDTISSTLEWAMTEMISNPDKMKKAQDEIAQVIGKGVVIKDADIARLPYLRCAVKETLRKHPVTPFLIPRKVEQELELCGYNVPKGSQVLVNVWAIGRDESIWKDAVTFNPERFLDSKVEIPGKDFELIPFGAGRRMCPGSPLAIRMVHVMLGSLLNCFKWKLEDGINASKGSDMEEKFGITLQKARPLLAVPIPL